jgi:hypothetical protein
MVAQVPPIFTVTVSIHEEVLTEATVGAAGMSS